MKEQLLELAGKWRREASETNFEHRSQSPAQTMKVDVLEGCAAELEKLLQEKTEGTER